MNTIHSSSLAFYPAGYVRPDANGFDKNQAKPVAIDNETGKNRPQQGVQASTPKQIETAIANAGLLTDNDYDQPTNIRAAKALAAYSETRNQPIQSQIANIISGIDLYA